MATQGAQTHEQSSLDDILHRIRGAGITATSIASKNEAISVLSKMLALDDVVLILTSGHMGGLVREIPAWLDTTYTNIKVGSYYF